MSTDLNVDRERAERLVGLDHIVLQVHVVRMFLLVDHLGEVVLETGGGGHAEHDDVLMGIRLKKMSESQTGAGNQKNLKF